MSVVYADRPQTMTGDILIADDTPINLQLLFNMLVKQGHKVRVSPNGELALQTIQLAPPDLILLDIVMPDICGYEVCRRLKANPSTCEIPIIFISALDQIEGIVKAFDVGGVDFVTKPFQCEEVLARVTAHLTIHRLQRELAIANEKLQSQNQQLQQEVEARKQAEAELATLATTDHLTQVSNRRHLFALGIHEVERTHRYQRPLSIIMLDIDHFKQINDRHGHAIGDLVICQTVKILQQTLRSIDHIGRYGGDEFIIILPETTLAEAEQAAERLRLSVRQGAIGEETTLQVSISLGVTGIAEFQDRPLTFEALLLLADQALYEAKAAGRNCVRTFSQPLLSVD